MLSVEDLCFYLSLVDCCEWNKLYSLCLSCNHRPELNKTELRYFLLKDCQYLLVKLPIIVLQVNNAIFVTSSASINALIFPYKILLC